MKLKLLFDADLNKYVQDPTSAGLATAIKAVEELTSELKKMQTQVRWRIAARSCERELRVLDADERRSRRVVW